MRRRSETLLTYSFLVEQVFRTDLITAMKIPDSYQLSPDEYYILADPWRQEWEKGVQIWQVLDRAEGRSLPEPDDRDHDYEALRRRTEEVTQERDELKADFATLQVEFLMAEH
uniref:Uncharacterized protein n=1 Tax=Sphaerodactylus townsendi TaxID=933632 RepID=A0ACB8EJA1_9SAUR